MKFTHLTALFAVMTVSFLMTACGGEPSIGETGQGIQIIKQTDMDLRVVAASGDAKVTIIVHRNELKSPEAVPDPSVNSPYDSDLIVRNRHGFSFVMSGNHGQPNDSDTEAANATAQNAFNQQEQLDDLQLAIVTVEDLRVTYGVGEQYRWELRSLFYLVDRTLRGASDMIDGIAMPEPTPGLIPPDLLNQGQVPTTREVSKGTEAESVAPSGETVATIRQAYTAPYNHRVGITYDPIYGSAGHHSAVFLEVYDSMGTFVGSVSTRNHGREATDPSMTGVGTGCPKTYSGRANQYPYMQPFVSTDTSGFADAGGCNTPYDDWPPTNYWHNCNDDSLAEYYNVKYNTGAVWATCSDTSFRYTAPGCT